MAQPVDITPDPRYVSSRGKADYFHGREQIIADFLDACDKSIETKGGTIFLVEGAPGSGKSALLIECAERAAKKGWRVAKHLYARALHDVTTMRRQVGASLHFRIESMKSGIWPVEVTATFAQPRPADVLRKKGPPLLLVYDEAQMLHNVSIIPRPNATRSIAIETLNLIHEGQLGRPVMLLAGGLGNLTKVFGEFEIARFAKNCRVVLGPLEPDAERAWLLDWLSTHAKAKGNPKVWIDAIMQETQGWPHHVLSYVIPALRRIYAANGAMTPQGLAHVLQAGWKNRESFYITRTNVFNPEQLRALVRPFAAEQSGTTRSYGAIMESLSAVVPHEEVESLFNEALRKGVIGRHGTEYVIPIPSIHAWVQRKYGIPQLARYN